MSEWTTSPSFQGFRSPHRLDLGHPPIVQRGYHDEFVDDLGIHCYPPPRFKAGVQKMGLFVALFVSTASFLQTYRNYHYDKTRGKKWLTALLGACVILGSLGGAYLQSKSSDALKRMVNTQVTFDPQIGDAPFNSEGVKNVLLVQEILARNNEARDMHVITRMTIATSKRRLTPNESAEADKNIWDNFFAFAQTKRKVAVPANIPKDGAYRMSDETLPLNEQFLADMKAFRARIYITGIAYWKNVSGTTDSSCSCIFLGSDMMHADYTISQRPTFHACPCSTDKFFE
jgi:hypothetical protein